MEAYLKLIKGEVGLDIGITKEELDKLKDRKKIEGNIEAHLPTMAKDFKPRNQTVYIFLDKSLDGVKVCPDQRFKYYKSRGDYKVNIGLQDFGRLEEFTSARYLSPSIDVLSYRWGNRDDINIFVLKEK